MSAENASGLYRVVLVDDHAIFRSGLRADLAQDIEIVGEAGTVEDAIEVISAQQPDVVLLDAVFSPRLAGFVLDAFGSSAPVAEIDEELDLLSDRELQVMRLIARGYSYKEVAKELFISVKTVESHVSNVLRKLQLSNRHELTRWAVDRKIF